MNEPVATIRAFLDANSDLADSALETATREWAETDCTWDILERSVRASLVYPGADNDILCPTPILDLGDDLVIKKKTRRQTAGTWVIGSLHGFRFDALVFPEHAENREWEIGDSKISKLWIQRLSDRRTVFNWDRGADIAAYNATVETIVGFLCDGLAEFTYAE